MGTARASLIQSLLSRGCCRSRRRRGRQFTVSSKYSTTCWLLMSNIFPFFWQSFKKFNTNCKKLSIKIISPTLYKYKSEILKQYLIPVYKFILLLFRPQRRNSCEIFIEKTYVLPLLISLHCSCVVFFYDSSYDVHFTLPYILV